MQSADQFTLLQGGGFAHALLSFLEIDQHGNVNVHSLPKRRHVTAGIGGFVDIISAAPAIVFVGSFTAGRRDIGIEDGALKIRADGPHTKFVNAVDSPTFSGQRALANGQKVLYVTERAVLELRPEGLTVVEIAPGVDLARDVLGKSEFELQVSPDLTTMSPRLFEPEPGGLTLTPMPAHSRITQLAR
jgi:acyl CoA:acetate/3-ketoacid CoA transferase